MDGNWISPWWQAACLPERWDVCGISVPPLSVWHTFALESFGNRYMVGGQIDLDDAAGLLLVASHDYQGGKRLLLEPLYRQRRIRGVQRILARLKWETVHDACTEYVETCTRTARRWRKMDGGGKQSAVPYQWHLVHLLARGAPGAIEAAWNTPFAVARCLYDAFAETQGDDKIMAPAHEALDDQMTAEEGNAG